MWALFYCSSIKRIRKSSGGEGAKKEISGKNVALSRKGESDFCCASFLILKKSYGTWNHEEHGAGLVVNSRLFARELGGGGWVWAELFMWLAAFAHKQIEIWTELVLWGHERPSFVFNSIQIASVCGG